MFAAAGYAGLQLIAMLTAVGSCAFALQNEPLADDVEEQLLDAKTAQDPYAFQMQPRNYVFPSSPLSKEAREAM